MVRSFAEQEATAELGRIRLSREHAIYVSTVYFNVHVRGNSVFSGLRGMRVLSAVQHITVVSGHVCSSGGGVRCAVSRLVRYTTSV